MKKRRSIYLSICAFILIIISSFFYIENQSNFRWYSIEVVISRMFLLLSFNLFFFSLLYVINLKHYLYLFILILIIGLLLWILSSYSPYFNSSSFPKILNYILDLIECSMYSVVSPGLILFTFFYIKKFTGRYKGANFLKKYHLHENLFGIILLAIGVMFMIIRVLLISHQIFENQLRLFLGFIVIFAFLLIYFGSFFLFRDWYDVKKLKFIEKIKSLDKNVDKSPFQPKAIFHIIKKEDLQFFKHPNHILYSFGILLTSVSLNMVAYGTLFISEQLFHLNEENIVLLGYIFVFIGSALIGIDWFRVIKRFYPNDYVDIKNQINKILADNSLN